MSIILNFGLILMVCLIVNIATLAVAIGSMYFQKQSYDNICRYQRKCFAFYIIIPAMALAFSSVGIIVNIIQIVLLSKHIFTRNHFFYLNLGLGLLWVPVIAIGWAPESRYYDYSINQYAIGITGWFIGAKLDYQRYQQAQGYIASRYTQSEINSINFNMGLLIMSCITFGFFCLVAICGLIALISGNSNSALTTAPTMVPSQRQWPTPTTYETKPPHTSAAGNSEFNYLGQKSAASLSGR